MSDKVYVYTTRVVDDTGEKIYRELQKHNRKISAIIFANIVFLGLVVVDFVKARLNGQEEDEE